MDVNPNNIFYSTFKINSMLETISNKKYEDIHRTDQTIHANNLYVDSINLEFCIYEYEYGFGHCFIAFRFLNKLMLNLK